MLNMFHQCPACGGKLIITECKCANCQLQLRGEFLPGEFANLSEDQIAFIRVFLRSRGNLTEVERMLGVSYPTIRNKLDEINGSLEGRGDTTAESGRSQTPSAFSDTEEARKAILQKVADGQLSAPEAIKELQDLKGGYRD
jgi:hypothetical protein